MLLPTRISYYSLIIYLFFTSCCTNTQELESITLLIKGKYEYLENKCEPCLAVENKPEHIATAFNTLPITSKMIDKLFIGDGLKNHIKNNLPTGNENVLVLKQMELLCLIDYELKCKDFSFYTDVLQASVNFVPSVNSLNIGDTAKISYSMLANNSLKPFEINVNGKKHEGEQASVYNTSEYVVEKSIDTLKGYALYFSYGDTTRFDFEYPLKFSRH
jgi:hypothetical protein